MKPDRDKLVASVTKARQEAVEECSQYCVYRALDALDEGEHEEYRALRRVARQLKENVK